MGFDNNGGGGTNPNNSNDSGSSEEDFMEGYGNGFWSTLSREEKRFRQWLDRKIYRENFGMAL